MRTTKKETALKYTFLMLTLLAVATEGANAQKSADQGMAVVYNDITEGSSAIHRDAKQAYVGRFRVIDVKQGEGFVPARLKGFNFKFRDPRSMREETAPCKVVFAFVVTADGRVRDPHVLQATDRRVSEYVIKVIDPRRFVPARFRGGAVASLYTDEISLTPSNPPDNSMFRNGLGIQGNRDR